LNYNINLKDSFIHLTNYSVQKYNKEFSKYETGNEVSFKDFEVRIINLAITKYGIWRKFIGFDGEDKGYY
jgi:hypothetical protein